MERGRRRRRAGENPSSALRKGGLELRSSLKEIRIVGRTQNSFIYSFIHSFIYIPTSMPSHSEGEESPFFKLPRLLSQPIHLSIHLFYSIYQIQSLSLSVCSQIQSLSLSVCSQIQPLSISVCSQTIHRLAICQSAILSTAVYRWIAHSFEYDFPSYALG